jgi:hypothetical protein
MTKAKVAPNRTFLENNSTPDDRQKFVNVAVYESLHNLVKETAKRNGLSMYEGYEIASRMYVQANNYVVPEIGEISSDEKAFIEDALHLYRNRNSNKVFGEIVNAFKAMSRVAMRTKV